MSGATRDHPSPARLGPPSPTMTRIEELVTSLLERELGHPVSLRKLHLEVARQIESRREGRIEAALDRLVERGEVLDLGGGQYFLAANLESVQRRFVEVMRAYHKALPYEPGMATGEIKKRFSKGKTRNARRNIDPLIFEMAMAASKEQGLIVEGDEGVSLAEFAPTPAQREAHRKLQLALLDHVDELRYHRIDLDDLARRLATDPRMVRSIFHRVLKQGTIVQYGDGRFMPAVALERILANLAAAFADQARLSTPEIKDLLGIPRNAVIPLLEYLDERGFTRRDGDERSLAASGDP
jgi:selenocysteine-specific elongation factor